MSMLEMAMLKDNGITVNLRQHKSRLRLKRKAANYSENKAMLLIFLTV